MICVDFVCYVKRGGKYGDMFKLPRDGMTERDQRILGWIETFLLVIEVLDDVLFRNFRGSGGRREEKETKSQGECSV